MTQTKDIFVISDKNKIVSLPDQVFLRKDFEFIFSLGGHLVEDDNQYSALMTTLKELGETDFYIRENLGPTITNRTKPFQAKVSTDSTLEYFNKLMHSFDGHFTMSTWSWYVHGQSPDWGIYIAEWPTILIIGCSINLIRKFQTVYKVTDNGYVEIRDFVVRELELSKDLNAIETFHKNYRVQSNAPQQER